MAKRRSRSRGSRSQAGPRWILAAAGAALAVGFFLFLRAAFAGDVQVSPVLLRVGPFSVRWYGLLIALSFIPGYYLAAAEARRKGIDPDWILDFALVAAVFGFVGARIGYVVQNLEFYLEQPGRILAVWEGGLSMHGVIAGGLLGAYFFARRRKLPFLPFVDINLPALLLGQAIGRWGNFFNQELFGYPTAIPWRMYVRPENRPPEFAQAAYFHPTFLYESLWNAAALVFLLWYRRLPVAREGDVLFLYLIVYSVGRFLVEFFRIGAPLAGGLTLAQWVSAALIPLALAGMLAMRTRRPAKATFRV